MTDLARRQEDDSFDQFIAVRKSDLVAALLKEDSFSSADDRATFRELCRMLAAIYHYEYFELLERLRGDYYYFSPEVAPHAAIDRPTQDRCYADLVRSLDKVLRDANFIEVPLREISDAHRRRTLRVEVKASLDDFREVRFYRRGRHSEQFEIAEWFGLRRRTVEADVYDDVVLVVAVKPPTEIASRRELRKLERRKIVPGAVLLKHFRDIAASDLNALFPNVRVVMSRLDKLVLSVPAIAGAIPILLNLYATITVLFLVVAFYLGVAASVEDKDMKAALAALTGLVALGSFVVRQWVKYQRQSLKYQIELTDNVYFRNLSNNAGIFDYMIGAAEDQECKEAFLAYYFLHAEAAPPTAGDLGDRVEAWLGKTFGIHTDFRVAEALARLERLGLVRREGSRLFVSPLAGASAQLQGVWAALFSQSGEAAPNEAKTA